MVDDLGVILSQQKATHIFQIDSGTGQLQRLLEHPALGGAVVVKMLSVLFIACQGAHPQHKLLQNRLLLRLKKSFQPLDFLECRRKIVRDLVCNNFPL